VQLLAGSLNSSDLRSTSSNSSTGITGGLRAGKDTPKPPRGGRALNRSCRGGRLGVHVGLQRHPRNRPRGRAERANLHQPRTLGEGRSTAGGASSFVGLTEPWQRERRGRRILPLGGDGWSGFSTNGTDLPTHATRSRLRCHGGDDRQVGRLSTTTASRPKAGRNGTGLRRAYKHAGHAAPRGESRAKASVRLVVRIGMNNSRDSWSESTRAEKTGHGPTRREERAVVRQRPART